MLVIHLVTDAAETSPRDEALADPISVGAHFTQCPNI